MTARKTLSTGSTRWFAAFVLFSVAGCADPADPAAIFNGRDLAGWEVLHETYYDAAGPVFVRDGRMILSAGEDLTGVRWTGRPPADDYEVSLEACRVEGSDFFCGLTFPVAGSHATLILGGWGGPVVGISNINDMSAEENETSTARQFRLGRWYRVRLRVADGRVVVWIDEEKVIDVETKDKRFDVWPQQEDARPLGIATWRTTGAIRNIRLRRL